MVNQYADIISEILPYIMIGLYICSVQGQG